MVRLGIALVVVMVALAAVVVTLLVDAPNDSPTLRAQAAAPAEVGCDTATEGTKQVAPKRDVALGPLVLLGARRTLRQPDAFDGQGYKVPVTLPEGMTATLSVPEPLRGRVGLAFSPRAQDAVLKSGMQGTDSAVRFTACAPTGEPGRTGWPGGLVIDRPRCATLIVSVAGQPPRRHRVPLGRRC